MDIHSGAKDKKTKYESEIDLRAGRNAKTKILAKYALSCALRNLEDCPGWMSARTWAVGTLVPMDWFFARWIKSRDTGNDNSLARHAEEKDESPRNGTSCSEIRRYSCAFFSSLRETSGIEQLGDALIIMCVSILW